MHIETVTLERIFDIQRHPASRYAQQSTEFSFEVNGTKHYGVQVAGWPALAIGHRITFALRARNNWQTVCGFKNQSTGELGTSGSSRSIQGIAQGLLLSLLMYLVSARASTPAGRTASATVLVFSLIVVALLVEQFIRSKRVAALLASID